ncbi:MAG: VPLPA-CTERM-specific exosortase XrtD [Gammaproteobacteria bacterium]|nr:VPLPA-CTERM-specific exosortase XrtD [Gammaproteobacteria bacterium]
MTSTLSFNDGSRTQVWQLSTNQWLALSFLAAVLATMFAGGLIRLERIWYGQAEYSYGYIVPAIALFLIWQNRDYLERTPFTGSWVGFGVALAGAFLYVLGELGAMYTLVQYAFVIVLEGVALAFVGRQAFRYLFVPLLMLAFTIPLPGFILSGLSQQLQLISSQLGVLVIKLFGISVYLEGNVIDLGVFKLQVVEACSGLRYLFPLMTIGFMLAYFYHGHMWKRVVLFLSTIPVTILMNSFRIGVIGIMVEYWGQSMAEGFLHDFEGWLVFMACTAILMFEIVVLARIGSDRMSFSEAFNIRLPAHRPVNVEVHSRDFTRPFIASLLLMSVVMGVMQAIPNRQPVELARKDFAVFPMRLGDWVGKFSPLEAQYIDALNFDDYVMANYHEPDGSAVNFYVGYYATQRKDKVPHSPEACIPGGGWEITKLTQAVPGSFLKRPIPLNKGQSPLQVNSLIIEKGSDRQLVYYWFQQRGRVLTNQWAVKWYIFWDALTRNRTDGALVRLVTPIGPGSAALNEANQRLSRFAAQVYPLLPAYVPD